MSLSSGRYQVSNAYKTLKLEWQATENVWRDIVRKEFAADHWEPLAARLSSVLTAMDRLDSSLAQMKADCSAGN